MTGRSALPVGLGVGTLALWWTTWALLLAERPAVTTSFMQATETLTSVTVVVCPLVAGVGAGLGWRLRRSTAVEVLAGMPRCAAARLFGRLLMTLYAVVSIGAALGVGVAAALTMPHGSVPSPLVLPGVVAALLNVAAHLAFGAALGVALPSVATVVGTVLAAYLGPWLALTTDARVDLYGLTGSSIAAQAAVSVSWFGVRRFGLFFAAVVFVAAAVVLVVLSPLTRRAMAAVVAASGVGVAGLALAGASVAPVTSADWRPYPFAAWECRPVGEHHSHACYPNDLGTMRGEFFAFVDRLDRAVGDGQVRRYAPSGAAVDVDGRPFVVETSLDDPREAWAGSTTDALIVEAGGAPFGDDVPSEACDAARARMLEVVHALIDGAGDPTGFDKAREGLRVCD